MRCPVCDAKMVRGHFGNHAEAWHKQAFGPFGMPLAFTPEGDPEGALSERPLFAGTSGGQDGFACPSCKSVVLLEPPAAEVAEDWECPMCGEIVPGKLDVCWKCQHRRSQTPK